MNASLRLSERVALVAGVSTSTFSLLPAVIVHLLPTVGWSLSLQFAALYLDIWVFQSEDHTRSS